MKKLLLLIAVVVAIPIIGILANLFLPDPPTLKDEAAKAKKQSAIVEIANPIVEKAIRKELKKPESKLTKSDLEKVTTLYLWDNQLIDVKGLEKLTQLRVLGLNENQLADVKGLENLMQLRWLSLDRNQLTQVPKGLRKLTQLKELWLSNNQLTDVKGLENLTQLKHLNLNDNPALTKAQIDELQKALPNCDIDHNAK